MVTLVILDGLGFKRERFANAVKASGTPFLNKLNKKYKHCLLRASGTAVGLPEGQMGNSEVGHMTLGAGRVVLQDLEKINRDIASEAFFSKPNLIQAINHALKNNSALHLIGLLSDGGVHSHIDHLKAIIDFADGQGVKKIFIHAFTDGRDTPVTSGQYFIDDIMALPAKPKIATICGRVYAMDREKRWERVKKAYDLLVFGKGEKFDNPLTAIRTSYSRSITDEFVEPMLIDKDGLIKDGDSVIFCNLRPDRAIELTSAFTEQNFDKFKVKKFKNLLFTTMVQYDSRFTCPVIYPPEVINDNLSAIISKAGKKQFHIAETTKYAHVTFFFNGTIEEPYKGEERVLIDSIDTTDFTPYPKMRAEEITQRVLEAIASQKYDFVLVNYSNPDMLGHTGNFNAAVEAVKCVDKYAYAVALATLMAGGDCIITADHGNAEVMYTSSGEPVTSHTTSPVPCVIVSNKKIKLNRKKGAGISSIAPTVLKLLSLPIPSVMDSPLIK